MGGSTQEQQAWAGAQDGVKVGGGWLFSATGAQAQALATASLPLLELGADFLWPGSKALIINSVYHSEAPIV